MPCHALTAGCLCRPPQDAEGWVGAIRAAISSTDAAPAAAAAAPAPSTLSPAAAEEKKKSPKPEKKKSPKPEKKKSPKPEKKAAEPKPEKKAEAPGIPALCSCFSRNAAGRVWLRWPHSLGVAWLLWPHALGPLAALILPLSLSTPPPLLPGPAASGDSDNLPDELTHGKPHQTDRSLHSKMEGATTSGDDWRKLREQWSKEPLAAEKAKREAGVMHTVRVFISSTFVECVQRAADVGRERRFLRL